LIDGTALKTVGRNVTGSCPSVRRIYYKGTIADWNAISINATNSPPFNQIPYVYSEYQPAEEGNYWHYSTNGEPIVWNISLSEYKVYALANAYTGTMGSTLLSCSDSYVKEMENDVGFMLEKTVYEGATIVSDVGGAILDNQMSKEQLYMIVLLDILGYNHAGKTENSELVGNILKYSTIADVYLKNANMVFDKDAFNQANFAGTLIGNGVDLIDRLVEGAQDRQIASLHLLGFALQCQNSIDVLIKIANDTNNDKNLRNASNKVIEIITAAFKDTLQELIDKDMDIQTAKDFGSVAINVIWDIACPFLPLKILSAIAEGTIIVLDIFCDTGVSIDAYYKLKVTSVIEKTLRKQINSLNGDYLRRENSTESPILYSVIDLYRSAILKGYEYTLAYLDSVGKDSAYIRSSYNHNITAFEQFENEIENTYYSLYGF